MKRRALESILAGLFVLGLLGCHKDESKGVPGVSIGVLPNEAAINLEPLQSELSKRIGMPVSFVKAHDYAELVEGFRKGDLDFAFFAPLTFLQAEREAGAKALLKKVYGNNEFYYSAIVVKADSKAKSVADLKGKRFGFVDPKSTSGYLYPRALLRKAGLDAGIGVGAGEKTLASEFLGTHSDALKGLMTGKVDAVGVWSDEPGANKGAWTEAPFDKADAQKFRVLEYSDPIPNDAFAVREQYYAEHPLIVFKMMEAMIGAGESPNNLLKKVLDVDRMATATSRHYDSVRVLENLAKESGK